MLRQLQFFGSSRRVFSLHRANEQREFGKPEIMVLNVFHFHPFFFFFSPPLREFSHPHSIVVVVVIRRIPFFLILLSDIKRVKVCFTMAHGFLMPLRLFVLYSLSFSAALSLSLVVVVGGRENSGERTVSVVGRLHNKDMTTMVPGVGVG